MSTIKIGKNIYNIVSIQKIVYSLQENFLIKISEDEYNYILDVIAITDSFFDEKNFFKLLNEQQLREILNAQFGKLREEIYHKAFSKFEE